MLNKKLYREYESNINKLLSENEKLEIDYLSGKIDRTEYDRKSRDLYLKSNKVNKKIFLDK